MCGPYFIPSHITELLEVVDVFNKETRIVSCINKTNIPNFREAKRDFLTSNFLYRLLNKVVMLYNTVF